MKRVQIYLTDKEFLAIAKIIKENGGGTRSEIVRKAIDIYIEKNNK